MSAPLVVEFAVEVPPARAFEIWTRRCAMWWPSTHTVSGNPEEIVFEPRPGGRILERGPDGSEHNWGRIIEWEPPTRLSYMWHLFFDPSDATEVHITFNPAGRDTTVRLKQRGWEHLGEAGSTRRTRTKQAWSVIAPSFTETCGNATPHSHRGSMP